MMNKRRQFLRNMAMASTAVPLIGGCQPVASIAQRLLDFTKPSDNLYGLLKLMGDVSGERTYYFQPGRIYAHSDEALPRHLLNYTGVTIREIRKGGEDRYASRYGGWMLMRDPTTNAVVDEWKNPWTEATHDVEHFVSTIGRQTFDANGLQRPAGFDGDFTWFDRPFVLPWQVIGDSVWAPYEQFSRYVDRKGNRRYENAIHTYEGSLTDLQNPDISSVSSRIASQSQSPFFPWMGTDNPGHMILSSLGKKLEALDDIPKNVRTDITDRYPDALSIEFDWEDDQ